MKPLKIILIIIAIIILAPLAMCTVAGTYVISAPHYDHYKCIGEAKTEEAKKACPN
jgi:hypothetical protein